MRKSRQATAEMRERILDVAAAMFNERGLEKTGVAEIMQAVGLTHGGFYKHFTSKDQLIAESVALAFERSQASFLHPDADRSLEGMVGEYL